MNPRRYLDYAAKMQAENQLQNDENDILYHTKGILSPLAITRDGPPHVPGSCGLAKFDVQEWTQCVEKWKTSLRYRKRLRSRRDGSMMGMGMGMGIRMGMSMGIRK